MKTCAMCHEPKPGEAFSRDTRSARRGQDGLQSSCKACRTAYHLANAGRVRAYNAAYCNANAGRISTRAAAYHAAGGRNRLPVHSVVASAGHRARRCAAPGRGVTVEEWQSVVDESLGLCAYCNDPSHLTMDHVMPLARGGAHDTENIAAACGPCNRSKGNTKLMCGWPDAPRLGRSHWPPEIRRTHRSTKGVRAISNPKAPTSPQPSTGPNSPSQSPAPTPKVPNDTRTAPSTPAHAPTTKDIKK